MKVSFFILFVWGITNNVYAQENKPSGESFCMPVVKHSPISQSVCSGSKIVFYSDATIYVGPIYTGIWKIKRNDSSEWTTIAESFNDTLVIDVVTEDLDQAQYIRVFTSPCNYVTVSNPAILTILPCTSWTGNLNSEWNNEQNWNNLIIPDTDTNVFIDKGKPNYPIINTNVFCKRLYLRPETFLKINSSGTLNITGIRH